MDECRKQFEEWLRDTHPDDEYLSRRLGLTETGFYRNEHIARMFSSWQAALNRRADSAALAAQNQELREALKVKLSKLDTGAANGPVDGGIKTVSDEAIELSVGRTKRTA